MPVLTFNFLCWTDAFMNYKSNNCKKYDLFYVIFTCFTKGYKNIYTGIDENFLNIYAKFERINYLIVYY